MHLAKLRAVAFVEDEHHMTIKNGMPFVAFDKSFQFLNGGNINFENYNEMLSLPESISSAISSACFSTISVASACISGG